MQGFYGTELEDTRSDSAWIHESSFVDAPCQIGDRSQVFPFSQIMSHTIIGNDCLIGQNVTIGSGVLIGDFSKVMNNTLLISGVVLEQEVYCGPATVFVSMNRIRAHQKSISKVSPTLVRQGANLGPHTTVAAGVTIGRFSFVEAGAVVDRDVPDYATMSGNPITFLGWRCECTAPLTFSSSKTVRPNAQKELNKSIKDRSLHPLSPINGPVAPTHQTQCIHCGRSYVKLSSQRVQPASEHSQAKKEQQAAKGF